jgi:3-hydroxyacyl-[acyl-carrier-protein] dehydratase
MRFHLIDRIVAWEPRRSVEAIKLTSSIEEHWIDGPGGPIMPPPLILEAFCQAGTWLIVASTEQRKRAALLQVGAVQWHRDVRPGDTLRIDGEAEAFGDETAVFSGTVTVGGERVLTATEIMCALIDVETLAGASDTTALLASILRPDGDPA